jgi:predicted NAD/FAD-binding protein
LREILRFNREAPKVLANPAAEGMTLGDFLDAGRYSPVFVDRYLIPMAGAVWSMAPEAMPMFPAVTLIRFMQNHGMLGINTHPKWKVDSRRKPFLPGPADRALPAAYYQGRDDYFH